MTSHISTVQTCKRCSFVWHENRDPVNQVCPHCGATVYSMPANFNTNVAQGSMNSRRENEKRLQRLCEILYFNNALDMETMETH
jgi:hypothetical protein